MSSLQPSGQLFWQDPSEKYPAAALLFLVENSEIVELRWDELRGLHLESILAQFETANKGVPTVLVTLESTPLEGQKPQQYSDWRTSLDNIKFSDKQENTLSVDTVGRAVDLLASFKFNNQEVYAHLFIVAATKPSSPEDATPATEGYAWTLVAEKLKQSNIFCHLCLIRNGEDLSSFSQMFEQAIWRQGNVEVPPPFAYDSSKFAFRFSARPQSDPKSKEVDIDNEVEGETAQNDYQAPLGTSQVVPDFKTLHTLPNVPFQSPTVPATTWDEIRSQASPTTVSGGSPSYGHSPQSQYSPSHRYSPPSYFNSKSSYFNSQPHSFATRSQIASPGGSEQHRRTRERVPYRQESSPTLAGGLNTSTVWGHPSVFNSRSTRHPDESSRLQQTRTGSSSLSLSSNQRWPTMSQLDSTTDGWNPRGQQYPNSRLYQPDSNTYLSRATIPTTAQQYSGVGISTPQEEQIEDAYINWNAARGSTIETIHSPALRSPGTQSHMSSPASLHSPGPTTVGGSVQGTSTSATLRASTSVSTGATAFQTGVRNSESDIQDILEDDEPFWMEAIALDEAIERYNRDRGRRS